MLRRSTVSISKCELDRLRCIQVVIDEQLKPGRPAERLELSVRQVKRLVARFRTQGPAAWSPGSAADQ